ncbi:MAG: DMT family transporter [Candidatus Aenigmarchaeota archaeon]|nr:DMT family transporter [Candidatus Aenigmarchaeota archaeon]
MEYGIIFAILSPLFSSIATIYQSAAVKIMNPIFVVSISGILGALILLFLIIISKEKINYRLIKANSKDIITTALLRNLAVAAIFAYGLSLTQGVKAIFFTKAEPYFVLFWHWIIRKEKIKSQHLLLLGVHAIGAILLSTGGLLQFGKAQTGDLLIIMAMFISGFSYIYASKIPKVLDPKISNAITMGLGGIILLPLALVLSQPSQFTEFTGWYYLLAYVILFSVISMTLWFASLKTVKSWIVSALRSLGPLAGLPFAWIVFGETLNTVQLVGGAIVVITSALIAREHFSRENSKQN